MRSESAPVVVQVVRNDLVESEHRARVVITAPGGAVEWSAGPVAEPMYPRSSSKPMQAVGMLRSRLDLDGELLALAGASHSGEDFHREGARQILAGVGLGPEVLQNIPDWPVDDDARIEWIRAGHGPEVIAMNCSGKHAAMIRTCVINDWPIENYRDPAHPLQVAIATAIAELAREPVGPAAVDGCGAPLFAISLTGLARAFGRTAAAADGPERKLAEAFRAYPEWASGTRRDEAALHRAIRGLVGKAGAEAVYAVGLPDGRGVALKIDDGSFRGRAPLMAATLRKLGYANATLDAQLAVPVLGHGEPVGELRVRL
ncbi:L-asparaginase II [Naumannella cuiyingiana]|uniref:L-asparaginase II n=1 Tax=Naumannella cuiyingiana TaxID=1347891 RepID=A0A7Z0ILF4_9ACTN|nr:asparaginase [Naumannella cuiyingiana]NYI71538.1 L-asparaginase II [Naumannella cuiyingiana]